MHLDTTRLTWPGSAGACQDRRVAHRPNPRSGKHPRPHSRQQPGDKHTAAHLDQAIAACMRALPEIRQLLPEPDQSGPQTGTIGRHAPESSEPWQGAAAGVYWTIHFGARRLENALRADVGLPPVRPERGGSEANTLTALIQIGRYSATITAGALQLAISCTDAWVRAIDRLVDHDQAEDWRPVPRTPGTLPPECPFCQRLTLRMNTRREVVRCFNPTCKDTEGNPPVARMERGRMSGEALLVFRDGREVDYRELAENPEE